MSLSPRLLRLALACLVALPLTAVVAAPSASAAATERVQTRTYRVTGSTEAAIRTSLDANRPGAYDARTQWFVNWSYTSRVRSGRCLVASSTVATRIVFTYPAWTAPADATEAVRTAWTRYMSRLRFHESGHASIGRLTARRIVATLGGTTARTCPALDRALRAAVARHFAAGNAADIAYDRRTQHGATQGAVFPAN